MFTLLNRVLFSVHIGLRTIYGVNVSFSGIFIFASFLNGVSTNGRGEGCRGGEGVFLCVCVCGGSVYYDRKEFA